MPVLTEGINIIARIQVIEAKYPGGLLAYAANCPNNTFCADENLARVGFMTPQDTEKWARNLEQLGFLLHDGQNWVDLVIVDQNEGPTGACPWVAWGRNAKGVAAAWLRETPAGQLSTPQGWKYEGSLSEKSGLVKIEDVPTHLQLLRTEGNIDVYFNNQTREEVYVGRTSS